MNIIFYVINVLLIIILVIFPMLLLARVFFNILFDTDFVLYYTACSSCCRKYIEFKSDTDTYVSIDYIECVFFSFVKMKDLCKTCKIIKDIIE